MKKILCLFDYVARTGFGTVSHNIVKELKKQFGDNLKLDIVAINYFGDAYYEDENTTVVSAKRSDVKEDDYGRHIFLKKLKEVDYDGVFIIQDLGHIVPILEIVDFIKKEKKENNIKQFKTIYYFPVDCNYIVPELTKNLEVCDLLVSYTNFGKNKIVEIRPELKNKIVVIPHGNNSKHFYPLPQKEIEIFRKEYFGENANKFIITNVNRNQPRKDIPNTIFGFIEVKKNIVGDKMPFLYLHCHPKDPLGADIRVLMKQTGLEEDVDYQLLPKKYEEAMVDVETLNKIYNASDCYITTTLGEGWGLTYSEAAACKIPIIAPYSTSFMEMSNYGKNAYMLETLYPYANNDSIIREQTDLYEVAEKIQEVMCDKINNTKQYQEKIQKSYEWVSNLDWSLLCKRWVEYFKEIYKLEKK